MKEKNYKTKKKIIIAAYDFKICYSHVMFFYDGFILKLVCLQCRASLFRIRRSIFQRILIGSKRLACHACHTKHFIFSGIMLSSVYKHDHLQLSVVSSFKRRAYPTTQW